MQNVSDIINAIGKKTLADGLGISTGAIDRAERIGTLPSLWFDTCERLIGRPLPRHLFTFKGLTE